MHVGVAFSMSMHPRIAISLLLISFCSIVRLFEAVESGNKEKLEGKEGGVIDGGLLLVRSVTVSRRGSHSPN